MEGQSYDLLDKSVISLKDTGVTKEGYRFAGWVSSDNEDVAYAPGMNLPTSEASGCMEAYFVKESEACQLVYDSGDGSGTIKDQWVEPGKYVRLPTSLDMSRQGYKFVGWATEKSASTADRTTTGADTGSRTMIESAYYLVTEDETIYAVWEATSFGPIFIVDDDDPVVIIPDSNKTDDGGRDVKVPVAIALAAAIVLVEIFILVEYRRD